MEPRFALALGDSLGNVLVVVVALFRWRRIDSGARWIAIAFGFWVLESIPMSITGALLGRYTVVQQELWLPVTTACFLWGLSHWCSSSSARAIIRVGIVAYTVAWTIGKIEFGQQSLFSEIWTPVQSLVVLGAAAYALVRNGMESADSPTIQAWFWICTGLMLNFGTEAPLDPLTASAFRLSGELSSKLVSAHTAISIVADLLVAWGMTCKAIRPASGGYSFSSASSRSS